MPNVDTNVIVRTFLNDDPVQARQAQNCLKQAADNKELFISSYALLEFVWILKVKKFSRQQIYHAILTLADAAGTTLGQRSVVLAAAGKYLKGSADFGDYMIIAEGEAHGVHSFKTFDQAVLNELSTASVP